MTAKKSAASAASEKNIDDARLWRAFTNNPSERRHEALWRTYQPLVRMVAEAFNAKSHGGFDGAALIDAGNVGLLDALAEFNPAAGGPFEAAAVPAIRQAMARSLAVMRAESSRHVLRLELAEAIAHPAAPDRKDAALVRFAAALLKTGITAKT